MSTHVVTLRHICSSHSGVSQFLALRLHHPNTIPYRHFLMAIRKTGVKLPPRGKSAAQQVKPTFGVNVRAPNMQVGAFVTSRFTTPEAEVPANFAEVDGLRGGYVDGISIELNSAQKRKTCKNAFDAPV